MIGEDEADDLERVEAVHDAERAEGKRRVEGVEHAGRWQARG